MEIFMGNDYMRIILGIVLTALFISVIKACRSKTDAGNKEISVKNMPLCAGAPATPGGLPELTPPKIYTKIGTSHLTISTSNKEAQVWFDQGLNHLHNFGHLEAYRAFRQVLKSDPNCAMGYWGVAMCQPGFGGEAGSVWLRAIEKAVSLKTQVTAFEKDLIEASEILVKQGLGENAIASFRTLYKNYPTQPEAIAFASIILRQHENEATQLEVKALLEKAMKRFPDHVALMHYYIHVMELRREFGTAKKVAEKMARLAPNAPHLTHMPGHLYYLSGDYEKAVAIYEKADRQEKAYLTSEKLPFTSNQNYIHNLQFLAVAQAEAADYKGALASAETLSQLTPDSTGANEGATAMLLYEGRILPALVHIRFREWKKAIAHFDALLNSPNQPLENTFVRKYFQVMRLYCLGMQAVTQEQLQQAINYGGTLSQLMMQYQQEGAAKQTTPEFKNINETYDIMNMARYELAGWIDNVDKTQPFNDAAWKEAISLQNAIKYDEPPRLMYPIEESLARLHKRRVEHTAYQESKRMALLKRPKSKVIYAL